MLADLPPEVWRIVFSYLTTQMSPIKHSELSAEALWKNCTFPDPHTIHDFPSTALYTNRPIPCRLWKPECKPSAEALSVVQVCHAWQDLGLEFLYHTVVFSTKSHFDILRVILAPPNGRGRFVRRVRIGCIAQIPPVDLPPVLNSCPNIEDIEAHESYPSRRLFSSFASFASQSSILHCSFSNRGPSPLLGSTPINLSLFTNLQTLHIVAVAALETVPAVLPQLSVLVLKFDGSSRYYCQCVAEWTLPSLRVLVCQWITTQGLNALCRAFAQTVELLEVIHYDSWASSSNTLEMPMLRHLVVDWLSSRYGPRFSISRHFHYLPSLTSVHINNLDRALRRTSLATLARLVERGVTTLAPNSQLAPQLQTIYVGAKLEDIAGGALERCFATNAAVGLVLRGKDGIWEVAGDGKLMLAEPITA